MIQKYKIFTTHTKSCDSIKWFLQKGSWVTTDSWPVTTRCQGLARGEQEADGGHNSPESVVHNIRRALFALLVSSLEPSAEQGDGQAWSRDISLILIFTSSAWSHLTWSTGRWPAPPLRWTSWRRSSSRQPPPGLLWKWVMLLQDSFENMIPFCF